MMIPKAEVEEDATQDVLNEVFDCIETLKAEAREDAINRDVLNSKCVRCTIEFFRANGDVLRRNIELKDMNSETQKVLLTLASE